MKNKIVLIGCGNVGMAYAYSLINQKTFVKELILIDKNIDKASGEALDLNHCTQFANSKIKVKVGEYYECDDADIIVITAGANQKVGETRKDLINKNSVIFKSIVDNISKTNFKGIYLVATNPLDVMTYLTFKYSKSTSNRVIGSGTTLDTARLRFLLSEKVKINSNNIEAYVIGEHGDSEFVAWSNATIGLKKINEFLSQNELDDIEEDVINSSYEIIQKKGATAYGIGICLTSITNAILEDQNTILSVSSYDKENDIYISTPAIVNRNGIQEKLFIPLNKEEQQKLAHSVNIIKDEIDKIREIEK